MSAVRTGLDVLLSSLPPFLRGARIGFVTSPSAVTSDLRHAIDAVVAAGDLSIVALFGPEHGLRGAAQAGEHVMSTSDERTGLPVHSLYGATRVPSAAMLAGIDVLMVDLQDIPVRYATFASTVFNLLEAAGPQGIDVVILDRPNALNGATVQGNVLDPAFRSFVGGHTVPIRHGLTFGELGRLYAREFGLREPEVVSMDGWRRLMWFDDTGLPWVLPSPNMPTLNTVTLYPATCLVEGTNLSEGRGTTRPFEVIGAPWVDGDALADRLRALDLDSVAFRSCSFVPTFSKHAGTVCGGVQIHVTDRAALDTPALGVHLLAQVQQLDSEHFAWIPSSNDDHPYFIDLLAGSDRLRSDLDSGIAAQSIVDRWRAEAASFNPRHASVALYD